MRARRRHEEHTNHERWLVSYADFMTLLFALFVVLFASSHHDRKSIRECIQSRQKRISGDGSLFQQR